MSKKILSVCLCCLMLCLSSCTPKDNKNTGVINEPTLNRENDLTDTATEPEETTEASFAPVNGVTQNESVLYGEKTGTDKTYTGLEPLPLTDFPTADLSDTGLSKTLREHCYGVATNETPHQISISNQKFFDDGEYDALCLDTGTKEKVLYLTFDCGYENGYTAKILDVLKEKDVKAAFFCTKPEMEENPEIIARMINEGHIVGNHSVTHPDFSTLTRQEMYEEIKGFDDYLREHFGYTALYFRFPQGKYSEDALDFINSMGYKCVFWSLAYADWDLNDQKGADYALETVMGRIHPGAVMLLHAVSPDNAGALGDIIDAAKSKGYIFKSLAES